MNLHKILDSNYIIESKNKKFNSPNELLYYMKQNFEYGWILNGKKMNTDSKKMNTEYYVMQPKQFEQYKVGTCHEQALYAYTKLIDMGFKCKLISIHQFYTSQHLFVIFKQNNKWFHLENAFQKYQGIHGPYNKIKTIIYDVHKQMIEGKDYGYSYKIIDPKKLLKLDINMYKYLTIVGFNFKKV